MPARSDDCVTPGSRSPDARAGLCRTRGSTSSGSAARACPPTPTSPARSGRRFAAGSCGTRSSWARSRGSRSTSAASPSPPEGWEVVVSTAHLHRIEGIPRADVPRRARRRAAGDRRRRRPRQDDDGGDDRVRPAARPGAIRPGSSAASCLSSAATPAPAAAGSSSRATSPTARSARCGRRSRCSPTSSSTTTRPTRPRRSCARSSTTGSPTVPHVVRSWELPPVELELAVPGEHNRQNAAAALAALELAGVPRAEAEAAIVRFTGVGRRLELVGERGGVTVYDDYGHNPTELEVTLRTARSLTSGRADRRLPAARRRAHAPAAPGARGRRSGSPTPRS